MISIPFFDQGLRQPTGHVGHTVEDSQEAHDIRFAFASVQNECIRVVDAIRLLPVQYFSSAFWNVGEKAERHRSIANGRVARRAEQVT